MKEFPAVPANKKSITKRRLIYGVGTNDANHLVHHQTKKISMVCPFYSRWKNMLKRCYSEKYHLKNQTYIGCTVCDEWLTFSKFKAWMIKQDWENNHLDKDIKYSGNKIYSPDTCIFVTSEINKLFNSHELDRGKYPKGVRLIKALNNFTSQCSVNGKQKHIGTFPTQESAGNAYRIFKSKLILSIAQQQHEPLRGYLVRIARETNNEKI